LAGVDISCAFATSMDTPEHVALAEELGYRRAWLYDSPALYPEVFMTLARCAERTSRIGLGPGVLIPSLRHPMTAAASIAGLEALAPGRVVIGVGSGFTGRHCLGKRPLAWATVAGYVRTVQALLRGEQTEWDGAIIQMLHPEGFGAARPVAVKWVVGVQGPKGQAVAREVGDGAFSLFAVEGFDWMVQLAFGTVLDDGEDAGSERAIAAAGPAVAVLLHGSYEQGAPLDPNWAEGIETIDASTRHLAVHDRHLVAVTERDRPYITGELIRAFTYTGTASEIGEKLETAAASGVTEIAFQPAGPDIPRELRAFADAAGAAS
jgi:5,10-methylenetetrahydromethanopterin reductase